MEWHDIMAAKIENKQHENGERQISISEIAQSSARRNHQRMASVSMAAESWRRNVSASIIIKKRKRHRRGENDVSA